MGLELNNEQHYRAVVDKFHDPSGGYYMTTRDYVLRPWTNNMTGPIMIYLPPVADAKGRFYSIIARAADAFNIIIIRHRGDSECWLGDIALTNKCQRVLLYSDGLAWIPIGGGGVGEWPGAMTTIPDATKHPSTFEPTTFEPTQAPTTLD